MRTPRPPKAALAGLALLFASAAYSDSYFLTRMDTHAPGPNSPIKVAAFTDPAAFVVLENTSDHSARCRVDFSTGSVPVATIEQNIPPRGRRIERSPVAGPVGVIDVDVNCRRASG